MRGKLILFVAFIALVALVIGVRKWLGPVAIEELSAEDFQAAEAMFASVLAGQAPATGELQRLGFITRQATPPQQATIIKEPKRSDRGHGRYVVRPVDEAPGALLVSAPHHKTDRHTGTLAEQLQTSPAVAAAAASSAPRSRGDIAHLERHAFTAFATAFAKVHPDGRIIQLHGFDQAGRKSAAAKNADVIISSGSEQPTAAVRAIRACLDRQLPAFRIALFPDDVMELGATTNAQGQALRRNGDDLFVHIELSLRLREALVGDAALRGRFGECLGTAA
jgi:hypothetical protein